MEPGNMEKHTAQAENRRSAPRGRAMPEERIVGEMPHRPAKRGLYTLISVIVLLSIAAFFARNKLFVLKTVQIDSVSEISREEVLRLAGIDSNTSYYGISEKKIREGIESSYYLQYEGYEKIWPDTLILYVKERKPAVNVLSGGLQYVLADDGMVLKCLNTLQLDNSCMKVSGLSIRDVRIGARIVCHTDEQLDAMIALLEELYLQGWRGEISELILSDLENIYLVTVDGYTVNIGSAQELRAKIGTVRAVVYELRNRGLRGGLISATVPGEASYRPVN